MSGLLQRYSSYSSTPAHHIRPSPAQAAASPPQDPFPPAPNSLKPSDVLINRSHQLKRFAKQLALYFQALSQAHHAHSLTLQKLPANIETPIREASIFLPSTLPATDASSTTHPGEGVAPLGGTGQEGWAQILQEIKDTNQRVSLAHQELAKRVTKDVVGPLNKSKESIKAHINAMEKDINRLCDAVARERDLTAPLLTKLQTALSSQPLRPQLADDPLVLRAQLEAQLSTQLQKENDLLVAVKAWTEKTESKEKELFAELAKCWRDWESTNSAMLLGNQQLSMFLSATVDSVPPESEWTHFLKLNHSIPSETPTKTLKDVEWEGKGDERCAILLEGALERQTSFLKSWKAAYFILTPTGHLLLYQPPAPASASPARSRASTLSIPPPTHHSLSSAVPSTSSNSSPNEEADSTSLSSISPTAFHLLTTATPLLTLHLPTCSLGPMPTPEHDVATGEPAKKKKGGLDAAFTLIENEGKGTKHIMRAVPPPPPPSASSNEGEEIAVAGGADEWETMGTWIKEISKFTLPAPPSPSLPSLPTSPSAVSLASVPPTPPALPSRSGPRDSNASPPLPQLPSPPLSAETIAPTPASMSIFGGFFGGGRSSVASTSTTSKSIATTASTAGDDDDDEQEEEEEVDLGGGMNGGGPPPLPPRDHHLSSNSRFSREFTQNDLEGDATPIIEDQVHRDTSDEEEEEEEGERTADEEDRGDLGRSLSPPPPPPSMLPHRAVPPPPPARTNSGRVANLAKAFDQEAAARSLSPTNSLTSPKLGGTKKVEEEGENERDVGDGEAEKEGEEGEEDTAVANGSGKKNGKKNKKKNKGGRKSKGDEEVDETDKPNLSLDRPLPPASSSPKSSDLSLASPPLDLGDSQLEFDESRDENNPFDLSLSHLRLDNDRDQEGGDLSGMSGPGEMSFDEEKLEREYGLDGEEKEEEVKSPPPMVLEEAEEGPGHEAEGETEGEKHERGEDKKE